MEYRVYDKKKKKWLKDDVFLAPNGDLYKSKGWGKPTFLHEDRYIFQKAIELNDKNDVPIFVGDYLEAHVAEDKMVRGMVTFAAELSSYIILCEDSYEYFTLGESVSSLIQVVGNVFDEDKKNKKNV